MKLIEPSVEIIPQKPGLQGIYEQIEIGARTCYKSENCIKYDEEGNSLTAKDFVDKIVNVYKHQSVAEHGTVYLKVPMDVVINSLAESEWDLLFHNHWTKYTCDSEFYYYTTNYRVILENKLSDVLKYLCEPTKWHEKRVSVKVICPISVSREWNRHRAFSISEQSTRYCNYSKDKFDNQIAFCCNLMDYSSIKQVLEDIEITYMTLINSGIKPQDARAILPLCTATEVVYTGFVSDWMEFFKLRTAEGAHPDIKDLATKLQNLFIENKYDY